MEKKIVILGAGESGTGAAILAHRKGYRVFVSDKNLIAPEYKGLLEAEGIAYEEGKHTAEQIADADEVVKSPGIPDSVPIVQQLKAIGANIVDELEFASRYTNCRFIAITGTNGKTTTTLLTYHLLKEAGINAGLAGNVGVSLARQLAEGKDFDWVVLEVSSFQIDGFRKFRPDVAVLLNITADHLDRYNNKIEEYVNSKFSLIKNMGEKDVFIYNEDDSLVNEGIQKRDCSARLKRVSAHNAEADAVAGGDTLRITDAEGDIEIFLPELPLKGRHNSMNMACASLAALVAGVGREKLPELLGSFKNAPHRMQPAGKIRGTEYINDSKATNVDAVFYALEAMVKPVIWIAGGIDKGNDYSQLEEVSGRVRALICLGKDNSKLREAFKEIIPSIYEAGSMREAVVSAMEIARKGDVVLLSPACASFDLFRNYEDRGRQFTAMVEELAKDQN